MTAAMVFTKKELIESWRTHRFLILTVVFLIFGILSPLMAKLLPELLKSGLGGVKVTVPTPTSLDSWTQYYKNLTQMGIYVFALMLGGCVSQEIQQGTLINLVTKGLPRWSVIVAKSVVGLLQWLWCIGLAFFFLSLIVFGSTLATNQYGGLLFTVIIVALLYVAQMIKKGHNLNPISLISDNMKILVDAADFAKLWPAMVVALVIGGGLFFAAIKVLNLKRL